MGKPFKSELDKIQDTITWALNQSVEDIADFIESSLDDPLLIVGSGGSLTAAHLVKLHHERIGACAKVITPYELLTTDENLRNSNILFLTAGGRNPDIIFSFKHAAKSEPRNLMAVCMRKKSTLKEIENVYNHAKVVDFSIPSGKDGFLATNSLIAFCTLFSHVYEIVLQQKEKIDEINIQKYDDYIDILGKANFEKITTFSVLFGKWGLPAAMDLESKFTEAAIRNVQLADFRNFAHGRHYWLAKNYDTSGIVVIYTPDEEKVVSKTLELLPKEVTIYRITSDYDGPKGALDLLIKVLYFVYIVASKQHLDPGCPSVPMFGRKIYRLNINSLVPKEKTPLALKHQEYIVIKRKADHTVFNDPENLSIWKGAYNNFIKNLNKTKFGSIIFDYDGTLLERGQRFSKLSPEIGSALIKLAENGIIVGIATGRGKSVRNELQSIIPSNYWDSFIIGYYNGGDIAFLYDNEHPNKNIEQNSELKKINDILTRDQIFEKYVDSKIIEYDPRPKQISVSVKKKIFKNSVKSRLINALIEGNLSDLKFLESSHSYDIIPSDVSKTDLMKYIQELAQQKGYLSEILCIGDKGRYPGNDYELLQNSVSLSVDEVSNNYENCWNIAPEGYCGVQATLKYIDCIKFHENYFKFKF